MSLETTVRVDVTIALGESATALPSRHRILSQLHDTLINVTSQDDDWHVVAVMSLAGEPGE